MNLELDEERSKIEPLEIWVKGELEVTAGLTMPFRCRVAPQLGKPEFDKGAIESKLCGVLTRLLPSDKVQVSNFKIIDEKPYGIRCDVKVNVFEFGFDLPGVEITTARIRLPQLSHCGSQQPFPSPQPLLWSIRCGSEFRAKIVRSDWGIYVGSGGVDKIFKVAARLEAAIKEQRFTVSGT